MTDDVSSKLLECRTYKASFKYLQNKHVLLEKPYKHS